MLSVQEGRLSTNNTTERMQMMTPSTRHATIFPQKLIMPVTNIRTPRMVAMLRSRLSVSRSCRLEVTSSSKVEMTEDVPSARKMILIRMRVRFFDPDFFLVARV